MKDKTLEFCFITWVTHDSRVSERMANVLPAKFVKNMQPVIMSLTDQLIITKLIAETIEQLQIRVVAFNVLPDHVHILLATHTESEMTESIRKIKGSASFRFKKQHPMDNSLWAQKFNRVWIEDDRHLATVTNYIQQNHVKHSDSWGKDMLCGFTETFKIISDAVCQTSEEILNWESRNEGLEKRTGKV